MSPSVASIVNGVNASSHQVSKKHPVHGFGTRAIHVGSDPSEETGAVIPSISLSTTYKQASVGVHKVRNSSTSCSTSRRRVILGGLSCVLNLDMAP